MASVDQVMELAMSWYEKEDRRKTGASMQRRRGGPTLALAVGTAKGAALSSGTAKHVQVEVTLTPPVTSMRLMPRSSLWQDVRWDS